MITQTFPSNVLLILANMIAQLFLIDKIHFPIDAPPIIFQLFSFIAIKPYNEIPPHSRLADR